jgi:mono/diheme cytochrome c family protein
LLIAIPFSLWSQDVPNGAEIFKTRCAACHGDNGQGFPGLKIPAVKGTTMNVEKLVAFITKGESGRTVHETPIANINAGEAKAIAEHVKSLK